MHAENSQERVCFQKGANRKPQPRREKGSEVDDVSVSSQEETSSEEGVKLKGAGKALRAFSQAIKETDAKEPFEACEKIHQGGGGAAGSDFRELMQAGGLHPLASVGQIQNLDEVSLRIVRGPSIPLDREPRSCGAPSDCAGRRRMADCLASSGHGRSPLSVPGLEEKYKS